MNQAQSVRKPDPGSALPVLSFLLTAYNEEANLEAMYGRIVSTCTENGISPFEIVFVDNGSWDRTGEILREMTVRDSRVVAVRLSRNFGYQGGIAAALHYARGTWAVVLDADQQDPPELVPRMLEKGREGYDVVYGVRAERKETMFRRIAFWLFYRLWRSSSNVNVPLDAGEYSLMHERVVRVINSMPERQRFMRGLRAWSGFRQCGIEYHRDARQAGESKFKFSAAVTLALDGLIAYSVVPIRVVLVLGGVLTCLASLVVSANAVVWLLNRCGVSVSLGLLPPGLTQLNMLVLMFSSFTILSLGIVGEYVGRIYEEVKQRPLFVVREVLAGPARVERT
jgi:dolichol-phosphate mannosyltransferase